MKLTWNETFTEYFALILIKLHYFYFHTFSWLSRYVQHHNRRKVKLLFLSWKFFKFSVQTWKLLYLSSMLHSCQWQLNMLEVKSNNHVFRFFVSRLWLHTRWTYTFSFNLTKYQINNKKPGKEYSSLFEQLKLWMKKKHIGNLSFEFTKEPSFDHDTVVIHPRWTYIIMLKFTHKIKNRTSRFFRFSHQIQTKVMIWNNIFEICLLNLQKNLHLIIKKKNGLASSMLNFSILSRSESCL